MTGFRKTSNIINRVLVCFSLVIWSAGTTWANEVLQQSSQCESMNFNMLIISKRNETGHWTTEMQLGRKSGGNETEHLEADIDQTVTKCVDGESVIITAKVTAPPMKAIKLRPDKSYDLIPRMGYYKLHSKPKIWSEALHTCKQENTHLLIINSEEEAKAIQPLWLDHPKNLGDWRDFWCFAGFHDHFEAGKFVTIFNEPLSETGYNKWSGEPRQSGENCGMVNLKGEYGDSPCSVPMTFICEQEL